MRLNGKVAMITGAGRGIGAATAKKFAREGAKVIVCDVREEEVAKTVAEIQDGGGEALGSVVDVTQRKDVKNVINQVIERFETLDVVVNNAGITADAQLTNMTDAQWDDVIDVNLKGVFIVTQEVTTIMKEQKRGVILNASSVVGSYGNFGQTNYAASKWGVNGMTKTWAKELGRYNIRVNAVAPGFILTPMTEKMPEKVLKVMEEKAVLNRLGTVEEVANGYAFLASDEASFITGTILAIDGGVVI
ncbi:3-oxoacyl-[acyl-carrier-protein] reductase [Halalkalibacterium halodurans]|uniref:3-oxoacyl-[acyl-carrier-protein] reductase n=1 Tax=Halalkalibacterium halodurans (strain ATCC BAA-125 / DSM 18197 / FERM 7344 / JCM 9153 / C-125) TaxID=272558 RepID=Q9K636_HALH5|nr:3-oxoacyl-[acyl-carrier-protein] reductase [Halalkalibacterium halodurans]MDY7224399.1 3-oxoacyl-[acyl-carrier-protein] reductase [Halalkalibacterium halodurans]MDY7243684.1 3-oxoacyl-[acyl-carrier-protein] reductase [Halalkalibacterium halodurans]MED3645831.1 3-oxoacyl-[acyl-carrier-protein] reductase [Halalkalibacterium halodurans]MED4079603.1 3-oxoacyl-[acyl-carrier-protein] reductase [Halalkalibacterium halodurans]MED4084120.1 3-oxoacyl-[acyl-carrier-protein] reductase [Halalkalibacteri